MGIRHRCRRRETKQSEVPHEPAAKCIHPRRQPGDPGTAGELQRPGRREQELHLRKAEKPLQIFEAYGCFEARIKIPTAQGTWPAFWMLGDDIEKAGWPACGEIDHGKHWEGTLRRYTDPSTGPGTPAAMELKRHTLCRKKNSALLTTFTFSTSGNRMPFASTWTVISMSLARDWYLRAGGSGVRSSSSFYSTSRSAATGREIGTPPRFFLKPCWWITYGYTNE